jgi:predicted DNA-binding transcriptional regulator YafY
MEPSTALTLVMASEFASKLMPEEVSTAMRPYVRQAENTLNAFGKKHENWKGKVRSVPRYLCFQKPDADPEIYHTVTNALLNDKRIVITYKEREASYQLHPLALVDRGLETILVAYVEEYEEHRQFMLHRINTAKASTISFKRPADFDIDKLIEEKYFSVPLDNDNYEPIKIEFKLFVRPDGAEPWLDIEGTPLSSDQLVQRSEDRQSATVSATVRDTQELRSWLLGLGAQLEVTEPAYLRQFMADSAEVLLDRYKKAPDT